jgi:IMP cyclohydrolase
MNILDLSADLKSNSYPGRGILLGKTPDGMHAVIAYFIMGRSENSRNRVFVEDDAGIKTQAFDPSKLTDPSLIIYSPVRVLGDTTIVTNGDQTDTVYDHLKEGKSFESALRTRTFEPDPPNFTPRISGMLHVSGGTMKYSLSILKSDKGSDASAVRYFYEYENPVNGEGRFIHTYRCDGNPIPSFEGEPKPVAVSGDIESFTKTVWESLNADNRVSLFTRFISLADGSVKSIIINKHK